MKDMSGIDRRKFLKLAGAAGIVMVGAACAPAAAPPTPTPTKAPSGGAATPKPAGAASPAALKPEEWRAQIYEAAKKEGQVVVYQTGTTKEVDEYRKVFSKTYPGVEIKDWVGTGEQIIEKMVTEFKAGKVNADFVMTPFEQWVVMLKEGIMDKWDSPEKVNFPTEAVDPNGIWVIDQAVVHVISYNTDLVPAADAPKSYQDLLKPVFKGKLGLEQEAYSWFSQRIQTWGKDKTVDYARKLVAQDLRFIKGHTTLADAVVSGEVWAAVNVYLHRVEQQKAKGAPVKWVADEPTGVEPNSIGLPKGAPHPNAGKLFLDWRLSQAGQEVTFKALSRHPMRKGASLPPELQVKMAVPTLETAATFGQNAALFKEIFKLI